jgi:hypothetical protein
VDIHAAPQAREPVLRSEPDPTREAVSTAVAARRYGWSRYYVAEQVRRGKIDGYGVPSREGRRTRWYVYKDRLPAKPEAAHTVLTSGHEQELLRHLLKARKRERLARTERRAAYRKLLDALDGMGAILKAAQEGDQGRLIELLVLTQETRTDGERRLLLAQQYEAEAEACLDEAVHSLLPPRQEVEPCASDDVSLASSVEGSVPKERDPRVSE